MDVVHEVHERDGRQEDVGGEAERPHVSLSIDEIANAKEGEKQQEDAERSGQQISASEPARQRDLDQREQEF